MGCVNSRADINDLHPNVFQVMNVDDLGNLITPGRLEVTEADIILYQRGKQSIKWPLRCLRRYGFDAEIFSFEAGRRCSTGPGIYAFKCRRAEHLFNLVQTNIQVCNNGGDDTLSTELPVASHPGPRVTIPVEPNYLDRTPTRTNNRMDTRFAHTQQNGSGRLDSVGSSTGLISPQGTMGSPSPPPMQPLLPPPLLPQPHPSSLYVNEEVLAFLPLEIEHNNNKSLRRAIQRSCTLSNTTSENDSLTEPTSTHRNSECASQSKPSSLPIGAYVNVDISSDVSPLSPTHSAFNVMQFREEKSEPIESGHAYMNISPGQEHTEPVSVRSRPPPLPSVPSEVEDGTRHCYANLEASEIEGLRKRFSGVSIAEKSPLPPSTPTGVPIREVNYAVLDLDKKDIPMNSQLDGPSNTMASPPESPSKIQKGYATIDFNKTAALSHSVNPNLVNDNEGSRKTRHNSTISDLAASCRHSSSVSE